MWMDFLIGLLAANAIPHYVLGRLNAGVLSLFGYGARANVAYSFVCAAASLTLFQMRYGLPALLEHPMLLGVLTIVLAYWLGWPVIERFLRKPTQSGS